MATRKNPRLVSRIPELCKQHGMSIYELQKRCGLSHSTLNQIANGLRTPSDLVIVAIFDALGVQPGQYLEVLPRP